MNAIIVYWSKTGNTEKVARALREGLMEGGYEVSLLRVEEAGDIDFFDYDLACFGFPVHQWNPAKPVDTYLREKSRDYRKQGRIRPRAPVVPGKNALIFCTYAGPHTGEREAEPAGLFAGQFFEHLGFTVLDVWYVVGEFHGREDLSTLGRFGDIRGRPNSDDLEKVRKDAARLVAGIGESTGTTPA